MGAFAAFLPKERGCVFDVSRSESDKSGLDGGLSPTIRCPRGSPRCLRANDRTPCSRSLGCVIEMVPCRLVLGPSNTSTSRRKRGQGQSALQMRVPRAASAATLQVELSGTAYRILRTRRRDQGYGALKCVEGEEKGEVTVCDRDVGVSLAVSHADELKTRGLKLGLMSWRPG